MVIVQRQKCKWISASRRRCSWSVPRQRTWGLYKYDIKQLTVDIIQFDPNPRSARQSIRRMSTQGRTWIADF